MNVESLVSSYVGRLRKERKAWAEKQRFGRIEDDLARDFARHALKGGHGALFNVGSKSRRFDVALGEADGPVHLSRITHLFEFKYVRNRHGVSAYNAADEVDGAAKVLARQLEGPPKAIHGIPVELRSKNNAVYGVLIASCIEGDGDVFTNDKAHGRARFRTFVEERLRKHRLAYVDLKRPQRWEAYEGTKVAGLLATLDVYLLRLKAS